MGLIYRTAGSVPEMASQLVTIINGRSSRKLRQIHTMKDSVWSMRSLGVSVEPSAGNPKVHVVSIELNDAGMILLDSFTLKTAESEPGAQAVTLARLLQGRLPGLSFEAAAIKTAGASPVGRRNRATFQRAHAEGALLFILHEVTDVRVLAKDAQGLATLSGKKKADLESAAEGLTERRYRDAAYAALALLP